MSRDVSGTYTLPEAAFVPSTVALAGRVNNNFSDIATALTGSLARNGSGGMTSNLAMNGNRVTGLSSPVASSDAVPRSYVDGAWLRVDQQTLGSGPTAYISPVLPTGLSAFRLEWQDARGNGEQAPFARFSTDGGATYRQGVSDYTIQGFAFVGVSAAAVLNATQSFITLGQNVSTGAVTRGSIEFSRTSGTFGVSSNGNFSGGLWVAQYGGAIAFTNVTNIQLGFASTTINTGTFTLFGRL